MSEGILSYLNEDFRELDMEERKILQKFLLPYQECWHLENEIGRVQRKLNGDCGTADVVLEIMLGHLMQQQLAILESEEAVKEGLKILRSLGDKVVSIDTGLRTNMTHDFIAPAMSSPTHSTANGDPKPITSASRLTTPTKSTSDSPRVFTPSKNPPIPKSPKEYFCEQELVEGPKCNVLVITRGFRENTYYEDNCSPDPERDEEMYTEKLELIKKQVQIKNMARDIERLTFNLAELQSVLDPATAKIDALQKQVNELAIAYQSKMAAIGEIKGTPNVLTITKDMSAAAILETRKTQARLAKLELETMESEIEMLEAQILVDAEKAVIHTKVSDFEATRAKLAVLTADIVVLKTEYQKSNLAWISKFSAEESTLQSNNAKDGTNDALTKLEQVSAENKALKEQIQVMLDKSTAASDDIVTDLKHTIAAGTAQNQANAMEIESLKAIISAGQAQNQGQANELQSLHAQNQAQVNELQSLKAYITQAQKDMDAKMNFKIMDLEGKVIGLEGKLEIMKPLYRLGRQARYRNNYSILRKKYEGQNVECNLDMYEEGYHARFGGHAIADSMMYHSHGGFDEMDPMGLFENNFEMLHYGITAKMVWDHRYDFTMLAEILDMAANMKAYGPKKNTTIKSATDGAVDFDRVDADDTDVDADEYDADDKFALVDFGNAEFKELFVKVISHVLPYYKTLAITSDDQFRNHQDLIDAFNAMYTISTEVVKKNYVARRKGIEDSWDQPWENAWEEWDDWVNEAMIRQMC
ncbi:hypothetical protein DL98DRAFT_655833 [Cadophora sp. DSE1049]|nr:hypothetical protein DL98DRAFT_655833 [Cadophora sp. DSE1049]